MSAGIKITLPKAEQDKFRAWVRQQTATTKHKCQNIVQTAAYKMHDQAVQQVPKHFAGGSGLAGSIHVQSSTDKLGAKVEAGKHYAPYVEFGTGKYVRVYPGYEAYAWQFKGRGIREVNLRARPYFIRNYELSKRWMLKELNKLGFK